MTCHNCLLCFRAVTTPQWWMLRPTYYIPSICRAPTVFLWTQDAVAKGRISFGKKPTAEMLADLLTKPLEQARVRYLLECMNYYYAEGRHHLALDV